MAPDHVDEQVDALLPLLGKEMQRGPDRDAVTDVVRAGLGDFGARSKLLQAATRLSVTHQLPGLRDPTVAVNRWFSQASTDLFAPPISHTALLVFIAEQQSQP